MWVPLLACAICLGSFFFFRERRFSAILLLTAVFFGGLFRMALDEMPPPADDISRMVGNEPSWVTVTGVIVSDPEVERIHRPSGNLGKEKEEYKIIFNLRADSVTRFGQPETTRGKLRVVVRRTSQVYAYGDHLKIRGRIQEPWAQKNFRLFDYSRWLERQDIRRIMMTPDGGMVETLARDQGNWLGAAGYKLRAKVNQTLKIGLENEPALSAVLSGMILGYREEIPDTINEEFQRTGTFHILAVSGQNLTFIAFVFIVLLRSFGVSKWRCGYVVLPVLVLYCASVGWQPGCLRAFWMAAVVIVSWILIKPFDLLNALGLACLVTLLWDPQQIFDIGFQFSFTVVLALVVVTPWCWERVKKHFEPDPFLIPELVSRRDKLWKYGGGGLTQMALSSCVAWVGSLPFTLAYFHTFAPVTVVANMFIVPMATIILSLGLISFLGGLLSPWVALIYNNANYLFLKVLLAGIHWFSTLPLACFYVSFAPVQMAPDECVIHCLESERSQAYVLQTRGRVYVIDTGNENAARHVLVPYLKALGVNRIDGLILSHADSQHIGGAPYLLRHFPVEEAWINPWAGRSSAWRQAREALENRGVKTVLFESPQTIFRGNSMECVIFPAPAPEGKIRRADETCPVVVLRNGEQRVLLTFDLPARQLEQIAPQTLEDGDAKADWVLAGFDTKEPTLPAQFARGIIFSTAGVRNHIRPQSENHRVRLVNTAKAGGAILRIRPESISVDTALTGRIE
ncbi:ComEC/Rec2 family competence protein [Oscillatoria amoena NRMC-F 0135]|nr:ComEC/Rec2 family competence protein [Oscillatoria amoena NRMC-F 0135]